MTTREMKDAAVPQAASKLFPGSFEYFATNILNTILIV